MAIPIYNCLISESLEDESGIYAISFVEEPANETNFIALNKEPKEEFLNKDKKKQILTGVVLRPEQLIYRNGVTPNGHYIKFSIEEIEKIAFKMMKTGIALKNTTHQHESTLNGNYLTELWIVENPQNDKSNALGFKDLPKGTLMCSYKIEDTEYWQKEVMSGNVKGFSLEGFFQEKQINFNKHNKYNHNVKANRSMKKKRSLLSRIGQFLLDIEEVENQDTTDSGESYRVFILKDGQEVFVDSDGFVTLNDAQLPAGEHPLSDGSILIVDEEGQFIETVEATIENVIPPEAVGAQTLSQQQMAKSATKQRNQSRMKKRKLEDEETENSESIEALKAKIAELEARIAELTEKAEEAQEEVEKAQEQIEELKKTKPSSNPSAQTQARKQHLSHADHVAGALMEVYNRKKSK